MSEAVRVCLAVALAAGLLAAAGPAVQDAQLARSDAAARTAVQTLADAVYSLVASSDPVPLDVRTSAASRTLSVDLPERSPTAAGPVTLFVGRPGVDGPRWNAVGYCVADQPRRWVRLPVDVRPRGVSDPPGASDVPGSLVLGGEVSLELRFVRVDGRPTVLVGIADGGRAFK